MSGNLEPAAPPLVEYAPIISETSALRAFYDPTALDAAHFRTQLRIRQGEYDISVDSKHIAQYQECVDDHADVDGRYQQARIGLLRDVLGVAIDDSDTRASYKFQTHTTWFIGHQQLSNGTPVRVAYEVRAMRDFEHPSPLTIRTHPMHWLPAGVEIRDSKMHSFSGILEGFVIFEGDAHVAEIKSDDVHLRQFKYVRADVTHKLTDEAFQETLRPWAQELEEFGDGIEAHPPDVTEQAPWDLIPKSAGEALQSLFEPRSGTGSHRPMARLLLEKPASTEEAINLLAKAFSPKAFSAFNLVLSKPMEQLNACIQELGIQQRFSWLTQNLTLICDRLQDAVLKKVSLGFRDAFVTELQQEEAKITLLNNLAKSFAAETTRVETSSLPKAAHA